jgi:hypothetical protein
MSKTRRHYSHPRMKNMIVGRDLFHLEHVTNGIRGGLHGGDKKSMKKQKRAREKRELKESY